MPDAEAGWALLESEAKNRPKPTELVDPVPLLEEFRKGYLESGRGADGWWPPYAWGLPVHRTEAGDGDHFLRVFTGNRQQGYWIMRESDLKRPDGSWLTAKEVEDKFALPGTPTQMTTVTPPNGTALYMSIAGPHKTSSGGGVQFQFVGRYEDTWFGVAVTYPPQGDL